MKDCTHCWEWFITTLTMILTEKLLNFFLMDCKYTDLQIWFVLGGMILTLRPFFQCESLWLYEICWIYSVLWCNIECKYCGRTCLLRGQQRVFDNIIIANGSPDFIDEVEALWKNWNWISNCWLPSPQDSWKGRCHNWPLDKIEWLFPSVHRGPNNIKDSKRDK